MQDYYDLADLLNILTGITRHYFDARNMQGPSGEDDLGLLLRFCETVAEFSERAGFTASVATAERMKRLIKGSAKVTRDEYLKFLEDLDSRLHDEAGAMLFLNSARARQIVSGS